MESPSSVNIIGLQQTNLSYMLKQRYQLFILVRHGERADDPSIPIDIRKHPSNDVIVDFDPQLSRPNGKDQAIKTAQFLRNKLEKQLAPDGTGVDLTQAEVFLFSSPFLACIESASALAKEFKVKTINVQDQLVDTLMKGWFPDDPFTGLSTKLTNNKDKFTNFLKAQYDVPELTLEYKRANSVVYPETVDGTNKR
jgi:hypothetical protein